MARPKKNQPTTTPEPITVIEPQIIEIALEDITICILMRLYGKTIDDIANYLKLPISQLENVNEFISPQSYILKILSKKLKSLDVFDLDNLDKNVKSLLIDYLIDKNNKLKQSSLITLEKSLKSLISDLEILKKAADSIIGEDIGGKRHRDIIKEIRATITTIAKLQDDLNKINNRKIESTVNTNTITLNTLKFDFGDDDDFNDGLSNGRVPLKPSPSSR
ncbi:hypothetical protein H6G64_35420 [Calothrix sp. FACHB-156]|nr:hypothetical protein [Calothrix sp. FACHB-156]